MRRRSVGIGELPAQLAKQQLGSLEHQDTRKSYNHYFPETLAQTPGPHSPTDINQHSFTEGSVKIQHTDSQILLLLTITALTVGEKMAEILVPLTQGHNRGVFPPSVSLPFEKLSRMKNL